MFDTILIANRGEIACRIIRTAKRLGIRTVTVYSDADATARHVTLADEAYRIGPPAAKESYLRIDAILDVARISGAQAIHPGYGFLSESAEFAEACEKSGVVFIGPPVAAIRAMGSKSTAKKIMQEAQVPLVPGYHGTNQNPDFLLQEAKKIGFPVIIKASAGGGGKGMRAVFQPQDFIEALGGAKRESMASFGDDHVLVEYYLTKPRHVEIQIFTDGQGNAVYLFERDCSIQRRHQKVLEESPAPGLTPKLREKMGNAAVVAAQSIGYVGAGTVEFLLNEDGSFFFMEMNTRLQVEHPVTEMITGQDLVEWQLRVAGGEQLPLAQQDLAISGHAIEVRIYAEDPSRDFLPAIGRISHLRTPAESTHLRIDTGIREGDEVSIHYDPMVAKLIVWDTDRTGTLRRLKNALEDFQVVGVTTNIGFLGRIAAHPAFAAGDFDTGFIERHRSELFPETAPASDRILALACLDVLLRRAAEASSSAAASTDPYSPWHFTGGWRLNCDNHYNLYFLDGETPVTVTVHYRQSGFELELPGGEMLVRGQFNADGNILADLGGTRIMATVVWHGVDLTIMARGCSHTLMIYDPFAPDTEEAGVGGGLTAPMPGKVVAVLVETGAQVEKGAPLMILEAMKMEHTINSPREGVIAQINYGIGALVDDGAELLSLRIEEGP